MSQAHHSILIYLVILGRHCYPCLLLYWRAKFMCTQLRVLVVLLGNLFFYSYRPPDLREKCPWECFFVCSLNMKTYNKSVKLELKKSIFRKVIYIITKLFLTHHWITQYLHWERTAVIDDGDLCVSESWDFVIRRLYSTQQLLCSMPYCIDIHMFSLITDMCTVSLDKPFIMSVLSLLIPWKKQVCLPQNQC